MAIRDILKNQLKKISVSDEEEKMLKKAGREIAEKISCSNAWAIIGGSLAKETLIKKEKQDVDIFVIFDSEDETKLLGAILKKAGIKTERVHGSRDYFQAGNKWVVFEIIPVVKIKNLKDVQNVTDFSVMHVNYVKKKIAKNKNLRNDIKLAKSFCFAQNVYGAESYINGFSGYALEVLVIYFGSFLKFLRGIGKKRIIDPEKQFKSEKKILNELNASKLHAPIILIDPVYKYRNITAGLSKETFEKFLNSAKKFLKNPSLDFFEKKEINIDEIKKTAEKKKARFIELKLITDRQGGNIAGTKMKKFFGFIVKNLERRGQEVLMQEFDYSEGKKARAYLIVKEKNEIEVGGIDENLRQAVRNFKRARKKTYRKNRKIWAKEKVSLEGIFAKLKNFEEEMGVEFEVKLQLDSN